MAFSSTALRPAEVLSGYAVMDGHREFPGMGWGVIARRNSEVAFAATRQMFWTIVGIGTIVAMLGHFPLRHHREPRLAPNLINLQKPPTASAAKTAPRACRGCAARRK